MKPFDLNVDRNPQASQPRQQAHLARARRTRREGPVELSRLLSRERDRVFHRRARKQPIGPPFDARGQLKPMFARSPIGLGGRSQDFCALCLVGGFQVLKCPSTAQIERVLANTEVARAVSLPLCDVGKSMLDGNSFS